jgi:hypothetical protein
MDRIVDSNALYQSKHWHTHHEYSRLNLYSDKPYSVQELSDKGWQDYISGYHDSGEPFSNYFGAGISGVIIENGEISNIIS